MFIHSQNSYQPNSQLLKGWVLAVGILWLLALWNFGAKTDDLGGSASPKSIAASADMPLHVNSEHSLTLKRFFARYKDQPKSTELSDPIWALTPGDFIAALPLVAANQHNPFVHSPCVSLYQLQTLNISRAPPLA